MNQHVLVATPIRDRAWCFEPWFACQLEAAQRAAEDGVEVSWLFLENDSQDETPALLDSWRRRLPDAVTVLRHDFGYAHYRDPQDERRVIEPSEKRELAALRNFLVEGALETGPERMVPAASRPGFVLMWDSDVFLPREALSRDPRSLLSTLLRHPNVMALAADVEHPGCHGRFHNYMVEVERKPGTYNHVDRKRPVCAERLLDQFVVGPQGQILRPTRFRPVGWGAPDLLFVARVEMAGAAFLLRREAFEPPLSARYGAHEQGEDVPLCEAIRAGDGLVAMYSGIRGLHLSRSVASQVMGEEALRVDLSAYPYGVGVEEWLRTQERVGVAT